MEVFDVALSESSAKAVRLTQIQHFLHSNPKGLTTKEIADLCGTCVRTIQRDLLCLQCDLKVPITQNGKRYSIMDTYVLPPISFTLHEAMSMTLASRLVLRQTDENNPHVESALSKLASMLPQDVGEHLRKSATMMGQKPLNPDQVRIFEQIAIAWCIHRQLKIQYQSMQRDEAREWLLDPYFVEMTSTGFSTYVIGQAKSHDRSGITTFKLDRIKDAEILDTVFTIPEDLSLDRFLESSWGVMQGEEIEVKLRFLPEVTRRVKESIWHPSQVIEDLPDGGCLMTLSVTGTLEMTPWIRGWGPDVEVLEPESLRSEFMEYVEKLSKLYFTT